MRGCTDSSAGWFVAVVAGVVAATFAFGQATSKPSSAPVPPPPRLRIELSTETPVIQVGETPRFRAVLVNDDEQPVSVVRPEDGSESAWRTPIVKWDPIHPTIRERCGK